MAHNGHWPFAEPPEPGLVKKVREAANALNGIADYLHQISSYTPKQLKELRQSYAEAEAQTADHEARKDAKLRERAERAFAQ
jgi:hypothetical protein